MSTNYSENEKEFFKKIITDFDVRIDGRDKLSMRNFEITNDIIPSCFSSLKLKLVDYDKEILITIKGELQKENCSNSDEFVLLNIDSINKIEDIKLKLQIEEHLKNLILRKLDQNAFFLKDNNGERTNYNWRLFIDVLIFDSIKISYLQIISIAVKKALLNLKLPNLVFF